VVPDPLPRVQYEVRLGQVSHKSLERFPVNIFHNAEPHQAGVPTDDADHRSAVIRERAVPAFLGAV
jgi:hypothetical protein